MSKRHLAYILILFALSGFTALIYEVVWGRYLKLLFGHAAYGQALTILLFMGGIGLGALIAGKYVRQIRNPLKCYAGVELLTALGAVLYHPLYEFAASFVYSDALLGFSPAAVTAVKLCLSALITLPGALALGATFPLIVTAVMRKQNTPEKWTVPVLYSLNAAGGAVGAAGASFVFLFHLGTQGTLMAAGTVNLFIALASWNLSREFNIRPSKDKAKLSAEPESRSLITALLAVTFFSSASSFICELGWIRLLALILGSSTYTFELIIAVFILGLAAGGLASQKIISSPKDAVIALGAVQIAMGCLAGITVFLYQPLFEMANAHHQLFAKTDLAYPLYHAYKALIALILVFPAAFTAGITLPLILSTVIRLGGSEAHAGYVYGLNTVGGVLGILLCSMLLLPVLQLKNTILAGSAIDVLLGILLLYFYAEKTPRWRLPASVTAATLLVSVSFYEFNPAVLSSGAFRVKKDLQGIIDNRKHAEIIHGRTASISFSKDKRSWDILTNGKVDASVSIPNDDGSREATADDETMALLAYLPMQTREEAYDAAVIGLGAGMTVHHLLADPLLKSVDVIEIEPAVIELARNLAPYNSRTYSDPRVNFITEDARTHFTRSPKKYDIIISEPSNLWVSGVSDLFTIEFYAELKKRLKREGVLAQWLHLYDFSNELLIPIMHALDYRFDHSHIFEIPSGGDIIVLSSNEPPLLNAYTRVFSLKEVELELRNYGWNSTLLSSGAFRCTSNMFSTLYEKYQPHSDYRPTADLLGERCMFTQERADLIMSASIGPPYYQELFDAEAMPQLKERIKRILETRKFEARTQYYLGLIQQTRRGQYPWHELRRLLISDLMLAADPIKWNKSDLVKQYRTAINTDNAPPYAKAEFDLIEAHALRDNAMLDKSIKALLKFDPSHWSLRSVRIAAIHYYQTRQPKRLRELYTAIVDQTATIFPKGEKAILQAMMEEINKSSPK